MEYDESSETSVDETIKHFFPQSRPLEGLDESVWKSNMVEMTTNAYERYD